LVLFSMPPSTMSTNYITITAASRQSDNKINC
jgi:hypothetical protein